MQCSCSRAQLCSRQTAPSVTAKMPTPAAAAWSWSLCPATRYSSACPHSRPRPLPQCLLRLLLRWLPQLPRPQFQASWRQQLPPQPHWRVRQTQLLARAEPARAEAAAAPAVAAAATAVLAAVPAVAAACWWPQLRTWAACSRWTCCWAMLTACRAGSWAGAATRVRWSRGCWLPYCEATCSNPSLPCLCPHGPRPLSPASACSQCAVCLRRALGGAGCGDRCGGAAAAARRAHVPRGEGGRNVFCSDRCHIGW